MIWAQLLVVLLFIYLGARLGGIGIGFMGGMGVVALSLLGLKPGAIPFDVISVIMSVIMAIAAMQVAGGMDFLVKMAEKILRKKSEIHHFPCANGDLFYDCACRYWSHRVLNTSSDC